MNILSLLFNEVIYRPLFNGLIFLYNVIPGHDFGIAIIALTVIIRFILYPLNQKQIKSQKEMQEIQPKVKEIQEKYKNDKEKQGRALMDLYREHKINPASGCLPLLVQFPILYALLSVFRNVLNPDKLNVLYGFISHPGVINHFFLGFFDLSKVSVMISNGSINFVSWGNLTLAVLTGLAQVWQSRMMVAQPPAIKSKESKDESMTAMTSKMMLYFLPAFTFILAATFPAGLALYWLTITVFGVVQQYFVLNPRTKQLEEGSK
jgi:YidC/Oxa1 family membrane protein insertase